MAKNLVFADADHLAVVCSDPTTPVSGNAVRWGPLVGVALTDEGGGGNATGYTTVDFGDRVWNLPTKGVNDSGNSAVAVGDALFYNDGDAFLSKKAAGYYAGTAMATVSSGATSTINVRLGNSPGSGTVAAGSIAQSKLAPNTLDDTVVGSVADSNVLGGIPVIFRVPVPAGVTGNVDVTLTHKVRVINAWLVKTTAAGGGAGSMTVKNGTNAITDAMSINVSDQVITRAASIDDAYHEIAGGGTLRVTRTRSASSDETCIVYVEAIRVA